MSSPTSWMPFWLAATWARRSDRLSCKFLVPLQPGILPGACRASVTAARMGSPLSHPPPVGWGAVLPSALIHTYSSSAGHYGEFPMSALPWPPKTLLTPTPGTPNPQPPAICSTFFPKPSPPGHPRLFL